MLSRAPSSACSIPVEEVAVLFRCGKCHQTPLQPPVYSCSSGHPTCSLCYQGVSTRCYKCKESLPGRNELLEDVLRSLPVQTCSLLTKCSVPLKESRSAFSLLQSPSLLEQLEQARVEAERAGPCGDSTTDSESSTILSNLGSLRPYHRPVKCPYPCERLVTCSALMPHFESYHKDVFVDAVHLDTDTCVNVSPQDLVDRDIGCMCLLVVQLDDKRNDKLLSPQNLMKMSKSSQEMLRRRVFISSLSVGRLHVPVDKVDSWFLAIWATCLYNVSPVTYTLSASSEFGPHSASFTGKLVSLHESQDPKDVVSRGECLLLPPGLLKEMQFSTHPLKLSITFHSNLPFHLGLPDNSSLGLPSSFC